LNKAVFAQSDDKAAKALLART
jgi:alkyl sulfatase BDS1-like metallo-beta-lactamase superfamily hydrolase